MTVNAVQSQICRRLRQTFHIFIFLLIVLTSAAPAQRVRIGAEIFLERYIDSLAGKQVGIICNHTSVLPNGVHIVDTLLHRGVNVTALFAPEHGIRGKIEAGKSVDMETDSATGLPVHSLYGGTKKPTMEMLADVDVLVFDMQDVGARFYTYISTMGYCMMAAGEYGKKFYVLDRPNPINGLDVEGPPLDLRMRSFIGLYPIPVRHGMTVGELAKMSIDMGYLNPSTANLTVVPMEGWKRSMWFDETGLPWIAPSPNMKTLATATVYPGTCLFEATNFSEGRGTEKPFEYIGLPGLNSKVVASKLNKLKLPGARFTPVQFTPQGTQPASSLKSKDKLCNGIFVQVTDRKAFKPVLTGVMMIATLKQLYPKKFVVNQGRFDRLLGDGQVSGRLEKGNIGKTIFSIYQSALERFIEQRKKYLLY
jgi:uncharacterized protein YbbC (DUF1343 family)